MASKMYTFKIKDLNVTVKVNDYICVELKTIGS